MNASDWLRFIHLSPFVRKWKELKISEDDLRHLECMIIERPKAGVVISGSLGVRKLRFAPPSWKRGKSGSLRVCYAFFEDYGTVALITAISKNEQENLTPDQKKQVAELVKRIEDSLALENTHEED